MSLIALPPAAEPQTSAPAHCFAAPDAFAALRAWRAWAARTRDSATTGFILVRGADGTGVLASQGLGGDAIIAIAHHSHRRLKTVQRAGASDAAMAASAEIPVVARQLRSLDDWAIEILLRTGAALIDSLVVGVRHRMGCFELLAWPRRAATTSASDAHELLSAMAPWIER